MPPPFRSVPGVLAEVCLHLLTAGQRDRADALRSAKDDRLVARGDDSGRDLKAGSELVVGHARDRVVNPQALGIDRNQCLAALVESQLEVGPATSRTKTTPTWWREAA